MKPHLCDASGLCLPPRIIAPACFKPDLRRVLKLRLSKLVQRVPDASKEAFFDKFDEVAPQLAHGSTSTKSNVHRRDAYLLLERYFVLAAERLAGTSPLGRQAPLVQMVSWLATPGKSGGERGQLCWQRPVNKLAICTKDCPLGLLRESTRLTWPEEK